MKIPWDLTQLDHADVLVAVFDPEGRVVDWSISCERMTGYSLDEIRGQPVWDFLLAPEEAAAAREGFREHLETRSRTQGESTWVTRRGERRWLSWSSRPVLGPDGRVEQVIGIGVDRTERKRLEEERESARRSTLLVESIVENLPDMIFVKDARALRFVLINRAGEELLGLSREEMINKGDHDFFPESEACFFQEKDRAVLSSGTLLDIPEEPIQTRLRGPRFLHTKKIPIKADDGTPLYLLGISEDITERKKMEAERTLLLERLAAAVRARDDFIAMVAHDLKNPLSTVSMSAIVLARAAAARQDERSRAGAEAIERSVERMERLINDMLDAATIEAGRFLLTRSLHDPLALTTEAVEMLKPLVAERNLRLEQRLARDLPLVDCDRERVQQVWSNLIDNAVKHTPPGGTITISGELEANQVRFAVADTGTGIAAEAVPHVFDRYWQASRARRGSVGLGLYIVKGIIEGHGGKVWAESRSGEGSTFFFTLPVALGSSPS